MQLDEHTGRLVARMPRPRHRIASPATQRRVLRSKTRPGMYPPTLAQQACFCFASLEGTNQSFRFRGVHLLYLYIHILSVIGSGPRA